MVSGARGGAGGGALAVRVARCLSINGTVRVNGGVGGEPDLVGESGGGGSGGAVHVVAASFLLSTGSISADGGNSGRHMFVNADAGGGGGGRIALHCASAASLPWLRSSLRMSAVGGVSPRNGRRAGSGTIYIDCGDMRSQLFIPVAADVSPARPTGIFVTNDTIWRVDILSDNPAASATLIVSNGDSSHVNATAHIYVVGPGITVTPNADDTVVQGCDGFAVARYFNLDGAVLGEAAAGSDLGCSGVCCVVPGCTGYSWSRALFTCVLYTNVTGLVPNIDVHSGVIKSALPGGAAS